MEQMKFTEDLLKQMPQEALIQLVLMLQQNINQLNKNVELLTEQIKIVNQRNYGRMRQSALQMKLNLSLLLKIFLKRKRKKVIKKTA